MGRWKRTEQIWTERSKKDVRLSMTSCRTIMGLEDLVISWRTKVHCA